MDVTREDLHSRDQVAASFDARAPGYTGSPWHQRCAERLVALCGLRRGDGVLDAATGTGLVALAAARAVGPEGRVRGVDISSGMLREAGVALAASGLTNVEFVHADATNLSPDWSGTFDMVTCAAGLLYMQHDAALREWWRLLKPGGRVAFSSMETGSPPPARIFRECAATFGLSLPDPCAPLGTPTACRTALEGAGFTVVDIVRESLEFGTQDLARAWESNFRAVAHGAVRSLDAGRQEALRLGYQDALAREERERPGTLALASILYAIGRR